MTHRGTAGFSVIEMLIALVVIAIAFSALALTQVSNLRASSRSRLLSDDKAAANQVLEQRMADVLHVDTSGVDGSATDDDPSNVYRSFYYIDYYYSCPSLATPQGVRGDSKDNLRHSINTTPMYTYLYDPNNPPTSAPIICNAHELVNSDTGTIRVDFGAEGEGGVLGEGDVLVWASAHHVDSSGNPTGNDAITLTNRITCYDVYPSPSADAPEPCPNPPDSGAAGGRPAP